MSRNIAIVGAFDDLRSPGVRLLEEAAALGPLTTLVTSDESIVAHTGKPPKFPLAERLYLLSSLRFVSKALPAGDLFPIDELKTEAISIWADAESSENEKRGEWCRKHQVEYRVFTSTQLSGFPVQSPLTRSSKGKKVVVTGCYDWFHSGHVRFFEEVSTYGDLYVVVGHDANIRLLKGAGHPLLPQEERRYMVGAVRHVTQALISSGQGWLDADPEIQVIKPDIYAVNEDGDRGGKKEYCAQRGIEYLVLKRSPAPGLPQRTSTNLRGF
ncbi:MAG TPA: adenylyltransferase/cytidyltransferase family protein [Verrucomicrobiae bacterium]|nr:adenylyltransferase/cytidyltransferase family protein [Verrucomicrobiae bacterium]